MVEACRSFSREPLTGAESYGPSCPFGRILYMPVPQVGHFPRAAARPFFMVTTLAPTMSLLALHLTQ